MSAAREQVTVRVDSHDVQVPAGASVAAALLVLEGLDRDTVAVFCGMGTCYACVADIDGRPAIRTCITPVVAGMRIDSVRRAGR